MKSKDEEIRKARKAGPGVRGVRSGAGTVRTSSATAQPRASESTEAVPEASSSSSPGKAGSAAKHTYDVGYKKWEKFDVDAALSTKIQTTSRWGY